MRVHRWFNLTVPTHVAAGDFVEVSLTPAVGVSEVDFVEELAERVIATYQGEQPRGPFIALEAPEPEAATRTKSFFQRLIDTQGNPTESFVTWASEALAHWVEESLGGATQSSMGPPHNSDPAFDVISVTFDGTAARLCVVQVKATESDLQGNASKAARRFARLERGDYDPELLNRLVVMNERMPLPAAPRELLFDLPGRSYRVSGVHGQEREGLTVLTRYDQQVAGPRERRKALFMRVSDWDGFWQTLASAVHARLS